MNNFNYTGFQSCMCTIYEFFLIGGVCFVSLHEDLVLNLRLASLL